MSWLSGPVPAWMGAASWLALADLALKGLVLLAAGHLVAAALLRASAAARHLVLLLAMVGLLILPLGSVLLPHWSILPLPAKSLDAAPLNEPRPSGSGLEDLPGQEGQGEGAAYERPSLTPPSASGRGQGEDEAHEKPNTPALPPATPTAPWTDWIVPLWLAGVGLSLLPLALGLISLGRLRRGSQVAGDGPDAGLLEECRRDLGLKRRCVLLCGGRSVMPMTWGLWRAKVLVPAEWAAWAAARKRVVLLHELAHAKRHDAWAQWLTQVACALHWFNPLAWWAAKRLHTWRERACDDRVLGVLAHGGIPMNIGTPAVESGAASGGWGRNQGFRLRPAPPGDRLPDPGPALGRPHGRNHGPALGPGRPAAGHSRPPEESAQRHLAFGHAGDPLGRGIHHPVVDPPRCRQHPGRPTDPKSRHLLGSGWPEPR